MPDIHQETLKWLTNCPSSDLNFKLNLLSANEATIVEAVRIVTLQPNNKTALKALNGRLRLVNKKPQLSYASQLLACRLCQHARPHCGNCCKTCTDTCNGRQLCFHDLSEKELVNRSHILIPDYHDLPEEETMRKKLPEVPVSAAEKSDPALHMEMETLRGEREERQAQEVEQVEREGRIADAFQIAGRIQAFTFMEKVVNVSTLMQLKGIKETKTYRDLPGIGTWEKYCEYLGLDRHTIDERLRQLDIFGASFLETCNQFSVSHRQLRQLRQLTHDGSVVIEGDCLTIGEETIPINPDHADELQTAIEQIITKKNELAARNEKLEKDFSGAVKEETKGLLTEKKALLKEVQRLKAFDPEEQDREWSVQQMTEIEKATAEYTLLISKFIIDPRLQEDRNLQARVSGHLQEAEMMLHDTRRQLDRVIDMFND